MWLWKGWGGGGHWVGVQKAELWHKQRPDEGHRSFEPDDSSVHRDRTDSTFRQLLSSGRQQRLSFDCITHTLPKQIGQARVSCPDIARH